MTQVESDRICKAQEFRRAMLKGFAQIGTACGALAAVSLAAIVVHAPTNVVVGSFIAALVVTVGSGSYLLIHEGE